MLFISGAEIVFIFFIILLVFGADKIPGIARGLAKGMNQIRQATDDIKSEIQNSDLEDPTKSLMDGLNDEVEDIKDNINNVSDSIKRDLKEAYDKFIEAEKYLDELKVDVENTKIK